MPITREDVKKFKELYKKETGEDISEEEALDSVTSLVEMVRLVYKPIKKSDLNKFEKV
jgi:hypothetical protein